RARATGEPLSGELIRRTQRHHRVDRRKGSITMQPVASVVQEEMRRASCSAPPKRMGVLAAAVVAALAGSSAWSQSQTAAIDAGVAGADLASVGDWTTINGDPAATRYSPLDEINRDNVDELEEAWSYTLNGASTAVPLVVDGVMYVPSGDRI